MDSLFIFLLFPLAFEAHIMVAHSKLISPSSMWEMNWALIPPLSALERNGEKICFGNIFRSFKCGFCFLSDLLLWREEKSRISAFPFLAGGVASSRGVSWRTGPSPAIPTTVGGRGAELLYDLSLRLFPPLSRIFPNSLGPVPKFSHLQNGDI